MSFFSLCASKQYCDRSKHYRKLFLSQKSIVFIKFAEQKGTVKNNFVIFLRFENLLTQRYLWKQLFETFLPCYQLQSGCVCWCGLFWFSLLFRILLFWPFLDILQQSFINLQIGWSKVFTFLKNQDFHTYRFEFSK